MANSENRTIFQRLSNVINVFGAPQTVNQKTVSTYNINADNKAILGTYQNREERDGELLALKQQKLLSYQWAKSGYDTAMEQMQGATQVKIMYRDADLMDAWPEIGAALDVMAEESTVINKDGKMLNIYSKSKRVKEVLEDLFVNRLNIHLMLPMIARATYKYGNEFMLLNIDQKNGVIGWRELPVYDIHRSENGIKQGTGHSNAVISSQQVNGIKSDEVLFLWQGHNEATPYKAWQIAHFRLMTDNIFLPYGTSHLNKARRSWRMLSMMEDAMLINRLERSIDRRMFKVNVGALDDADVPAFLNEFMNSVKRAPVVDPKTGQVDLRKNFLDVGADYVVPVRNGQDPSDITTIQGSQSQVSMEDIEYMEKKVLAALKVPKTYLNFADKDGKAQNLSSVDIRFSRAVNKGQQSLLLELNKIAIIHLYLMGFEDDLTNFTLTLNNPSNQVEMLEMDNLTKRISAATAALSEMGGGVPLMSWHQVQKEIMGKSDEEIFNILNEMRLEKAMAAELENTAQVINNTGMFKNVDRLYGNPDAAQTAPSEGGEEGGVGGGGFGGPALGGDIGGDMGGDMLGDLGEPGSDEMGEIGGEEGSMPMDEDMPMESTHNKKPVINETSSIDIYLNYLKSLTREKEEFNIVDKTRIITESIDENINKVLNVIEE